MIRAGLRQICSSLDGVSFAVVDWDGRETRYGEGVPRFTIRFHDRTACLGVMLDPGRGFGDAYVAGRVEVDGDLDALIRTALVHDVQRARSGWLRAAGRVALSLVQRNTIRRAHRNVAFHYDLGNDFYKLWLGRDMVYSCAYFHTRDDDVDVAQTNKLDHICRKLQLRPGHTLLDVGCGWGALVLHAARYYGARALGITLSVEQKAEADRRIAAAQMADRVSVELCDYRELPSERTFDRIASIGMLEHVGRAYFPAMMEAMVQTLRPGGLALVQTIGSPLGSAPTPWIARNIFPGIYLPALGEVTSAAAAAGLRVVDVESLRYHYAMTMQRWAQAFEANADAVREAYGPEFERKWRLYLRGCAVGFACGKLDLWQICLVNGVNNDLPLTRSHLYSDAPAPIPRQHVGPAPVVDSEDGHPVSVHTHRSIS